MQTAEMTRIDKIIKNSTFQALIGKIKEQEKNRRFCRHDIGHCMDVARIAYILNLEEGYGLSKEMIYAAALLHDIGRAEIPETGVDHHVVSVEYAERILTEAGFDRNEETQILEAVFMHNTDGLSKPGLPVLLFRADKLSRACYSCEAYEDCYWKTEDKNKGVSY